MLEKDENLGVLNAKLRPRVNGSRLVEHIVAFAAKRKSWFFCRSSVLRFPVSDSRIQGQAFAVRAARAAREAATGRRSTVARASPGGFFAVDEVRGGGERRGRLGGTMIGRNLESCPLGARLVHAGSSIYTAPGRDRAGNACRASERASECILFINEPSPRRRSCLPMILIKRPSSELATPERN